MVYVSRYHMKLSHCRLLDYAKIHILLDIFLNIYIYIYDVQYMEHICTRNIRDFNFKVSLHQMATHMHRKQCQLLVLTENRERGLLQTH